MVLIYSTLGTYSSNKKFPDTPSVRGRLDCGRFLSPAQCPWNRVLRGSSRPSEARPQSAMRPQRRALCPQGQLPFLNPEQSAALATVQVGKTAPQGAPGDTRCARRSRDHGHRERRPPPRRGLDTQVLASAPSLLQRLGADGATTRI